MDAIVKAIGEQFDIEGLNLFVSEAKEAMEKVPVLEELVKSLRDGEDTKLAEKISPPITKQMAWSRASQSSENVVSEDDKIVKEKPKGNWFSEATNTEPLEAVQ